MHAKSLAVVVWLACLAQTPVGAQFDPDAPEPIDRVRGTVLVHGGGTLSATLRKAFLGFAGGEKAKLVVLADATVGEDELAAWRTAGAAEVRELQAKSREDAESPEFSECFAATRCVWISGDPVRLVRRYVDTPVEAVLRAIVERGGAVGGPAILSRWLEADDARKGFDLLPGVIVTPQFEADRLRRAVAANPDRVGVGVENDTAVVLRGRSLTVLGESAATLMLAPSARRPERVERIKAGGKADLIAWSRAALARQYPFPEMPPVPRVTSGSLVIVGGGGVPKGLLRRFIELAGGPDAPLVYVPSEEAEQIPQEPGFVAALRKLGAKHVSWIHTKNRRTAREDAEFLKPLKDARGIWFGGGRQWNLVDSYQHTTAHCLMHAVLERGGVIGGSSAGASIQGDYMPRGDPLGNLVMMAEGYETGLGFLTGVAIDQHFRQRKRFADMSALVKTYPQLLGIGIDEATAIVVRHEVAEIVGEGKVAFFDPRRPQSDGEADYVQFAAGQLYDLVERRETEP